MKNFCVLEYNTTVNGHYQYLDDIFENPETHVTEHYSTTDQPAKAICWPTKQEADTFLAGLPFKEDFHVQRMIEG